MFLFLNLKKEGGKVGGSNEEDVFGDTSFETKNAALFVCLELAI